MTYMGDIDFMIKEKGIEVSNDGKRKAELKLRVKSTSSRMGVQHQRTSCLGPDDEKDEHVEKTRGQGGMRGPFQIRVK